MQRNKKKGSRLFSFLFGAVFLVAGLAVAFFTFGNMTLQYLASDNWHSVPAKISSLDLVVNSGESTTYGVDATYSYVFEGQPFQNDKVSFSSGTDNVGDYWQDLHHRLRTEQSNDTVVALVNPDNPSEAVLDRTFRWEQVAFGSMFILMFGGAGLAVMWFSVKGGKKQQQIIEEAKEGIASNQKSGFWLMFWFGSVFFVMGSFFFVMVLPDIINKREYEALFTLLFVAVGGGIMAFAVSNIRRYKLIGPTPLYLDPLPGAIGGQVGAAFDIACMSIDGPVEVKLTCQRRVKSGKNTSIRVLWQETMQAYGTQSSKGMNMRFVFDCPADLPEKGDNGVEWEVIAQGQLKIKSKQVKFSRGWFIPVYQNVATSQSSITIPARFIEQQEHAKQQAAQADAASIVQLNQQGQYLNVESTAGRPVVGSLFGVLFALAFGGAGLFTITQNWWPGYIFVGIGLVALLAALFVLGREIDLKIDTQTRILYMRRKWFGIVLYEREVMLLEPSQFTLKKTSHSNSGSNLTEYYALKIDSNGKQVLVAEGIKGKEVAQAVKQEIIEQAFPARY